MLYSEPDLISCLKRILSSENVSLECALEGKRLGEHLDRLDPNIETKFGYQMFSRSHLMCMLGDCIAEDTQTVASSDELDPGYIPILARLRTVFNTTESVEEIVWTIEGARRPELSPHKKEVRPSSQSEQGGARLGLKDVPPSLSYEGEVELPVELQALVKDRFLILYEAKYASNEIMRKRFEGLAFVYYHILLLYLIDTVWAFTGEVGTYELRQTSGSVLRIIDLRPK